MWKNSIFKNQQINSDLQPVLLNFWVLYKVLFTQLTNQQLNNSTVQQLNKSTDQQVNSPASQQFNTSTHQQINSDLQPVPLNFWVWHTLSFTKSTYQQENALLILRDVEETPDKINKSTVFCNLLLWIFGSIESSKLKNQQINSKTRYQYSNTEKKPKIKSTNQQWSATSSSDFLGLAQAVIYKINKSTGKRAIDTQRLGRNPW